MGSDVYAFGVLLWSFYTGQLPYVPRDDALVPNVLFPHFKSRSISDPVHVHYKRLALQCLRTDPHQRPTFTVIKNMLSLILGSHISCPAPVSTGVARVDLARLAGSRVQRSRPDLRPSPTPAPAACALDATAFVQEGAKGINSAVSSSFSKSRCLLASCLLPLAPAQEQAIQPATSLTQAQATQAASPPAQPGSPPPGIEAMQEPARAQPRAPSVLREPGEAAGQRPACTV